MLALARKTRLQKNVLGLDINKRLPKKLLMDLRRFPTCHWA